LTILKIGADSTCLLSFSNGEEALYLSHVVRLDYLRLTLLPATENATTPYRIWFFKNSNEYLFHSKSGDVILSATSVYNLKSVGLPSVYHGIPAAGTGIICPMGRHVFTNKVALIPTDPEE